jgi:hypothetical protein
MSELVQRLRAMQHPISYSGAAATFGPITLDFRLFGEAADEIERLAAQLTEANLYHAIDAMQRELARLRGPREPPHCATCGCHSAAL